MNDDAVFEIRNMVEQRQDFSKFSVLDQKLDLGNGNFKVLILQQTRDGEWPFEYSGLELSGDDLARDTDLKILTMQMLFSQRTGQVHLEKIQIEISGWLWGLQYLEVRKNG